MIVCSQSLGNSILILLQSELSLHCSLVLNVVFTHSLSARIGSFVQSSQASSCHLILSCADENFPSSIVLKTHRKLPYNIFSLVGGNENFLDPAQVDVTLEITKPTPK